MSPLPELNLRLTDSSSSDLCEDEKIVVRSDSGLKKHTITLIISDQEVGKIDLKIGEKSIEIPTYKLTVTDNKTEETQAYQVTRDTLSFTKVETKKSLLSFFGFKKFDKTSYLYENIPFEPQLESIEKFDISKYRKLSQETLIYELGSSDKKVVLYAGDLNEFKKTDNIGQYFIVVDENYGKSFIGDILYREKFLKITSKVELHIIKRNKVPKNFEYNEKGGIKRIIYI